MTYDTLLWLGKVSVLLHATIIILVATNINYIRIKAKLLQNYFFFLAPIFNFPLCPTGVSGQCRSMYAQLASQPLLTVRPPKLPSFPKRNITVYSTVPSSLPSEAKNP